eukprot:1180123-Alexandrium_andersonii.AAC.1
MAVVATGGHQPTQTGAIYPERMDALKLPHGRLAVASCCCQQEAVQHTAQGVDHCLLYTSDAADDM